MIWDSKNKSTSDTLLKMLTWPSRHQVPRGSLQINCDLECDSECILYDARSLLMSDFIIEK